MNGRSGIRVLVAGDDYYASLAAVRGLRAGGYEPWLAAGVEGTYASRSRATAGTIAVPSPSQGEDRFVQELARAAERISANVVLPGTEPAVVALAGRADAFPPGTAVAANEPEVVALATDKTMLGSIAAEVGLLSPPSVELVPGEVTTSKASASRPS